MYEIYKDDKNLQGLWRMEESSGNRFDSSINGNTLTDNNTVGSSASCMEGIRSADFESSASEYLSITDSAQHGLGITGNISLGCWFKPESVAGTSKLVTKYLVTGNQRGYQMDVTTTYVMVWLSSNGTATVSASTASGVIAAGNWYHIVMVYNGIDIRIYVNGALSNNGANNPLTYAGGIANVTAQFEIGRRHSGTDYADGLIDEAFVFDRALSADEIASIYNYRIQDPAYMTTQRGHWGSTA